MAKAKKSTKTKSKKENKQITFKKNTNESVGASIAYKIKEGYFLTDSGKRVIIKKYAEQVLDIKE